MLRPKLGQFIGEPIVPDPEALAAIQTRPGEPALPTRFTWRGQQHVVVAVLRTWADTRRDRDGSSARYRGRHWFRVRTSAGLIMNIYFERHPRSRAQARQRWWLHSIG